MPKTREPSVAWHLKLKRQLKDAAPISASTDVIGTIGSAVTMELSQRGFTIGPDAVHVDIAVDRFYAHFREGILFLVL